MKFTRLRVSLTLLVLSASVQAATMTAQTPASAAIATAPISPATSSNVPKAPRVRFHTSLGNLTFKLYPDVAPQSVAHIKELVKAGAYDSTRFCRIEPGFVAQTALVYDRLTPLTPAQLAVIHPVKAEF